mgnify:CR=1 FL=1
MVCLHDEEEAEPEKPTRVKWFRDEKNLNVIDIEVDKAAAIIKAE